MPRVYESIKNKLHIPKIIHLIGTNGKGTTGRFLASALYTLGFKVGHYTSPHILEFNERIWLNGKVVSNESLEETHIKLLNILSKESADSLSYFEYTTLLAILIYADVDYIILEAGLGGEHDATSVFPNILTLVTPIDRDHEAFLGETIQEIATTKLNAIQKRVILGNQTHNEVYEIVDKISKSKGITAEKFSILLEAIDYEKIENIAKENDLPQYLRENLMLSISALKALGIEYKTDSFTNSRLFGRLTKLSENVIIDVGHNSLAANSIVKSLSPHKYTLIYNSYKDKNYKEILRTLKPIIKDVEIIEIEDDSRVEELLIMKETVEELGFKYKLFKEIVPENNYLVFGSFSVAEAFLKVYNG
ncbi:bifunctional folylpolyglutamate synthase/dihydrofolate synthase [Sulfurimonas aquatica]|uniref:Bifunctional folylpolyglutamate synthase/dihydrofolate synthase n=2 Tax=Sulfurimonas aquatica TaxID=2672570 RepID=A0A975B2R4_9BACT|nr:bifunctional folylpolyglutamate synthase/dihydrofolate synthase [Sulfurimonas aquatica]